MAEKHDCFDANDCSARHKYLVGRRFFSTLPDSRSAVWSLIFSPRLAQNQHDWHEPCLMITNANVL